MNIEKEYDLICVGGGIMSATLALISKILKPDLKVLIVERLDAVAQESSAAWNNAGTGHSALCELNYCPEEEGQVVIEKAIKICQQFEESKQFWSYLVAEGLLEDPDGFISAVPHHSWVLGQENSDYLEQRFETMKKHFMFDTIQFTKDKSKMKEWFPLIMHDREEDEVMAASRIDRGTEVNYGALTKALFNILETKFDTPVYCNMEVKDIDPSPDIDWTVEVENLKTKEQYNLESKHVFIGAGGGSLLLLQKVEIEEKEGYGGFPISGEWLVCKNEALIKQHNAKVYSKAGLGDPPMSTPHLDTRFINGKRELLFGPFAGFSPKFLKAGSNFDLFKSVKFDNISPLLGAFWHNLPLTRYLIEQVTSSHEDRMTELRKFVKDANSDDWEILVAGQRVQIIKKDEFEGGVLQFGTEVVSSKNGSITCLLGASPGASTATSVMLEVLEKAFPEVLHSENGKKIMNKMIPFFNTEVTEALFKAQLDISKRALKL
ncbi:MULTISPECIES: malate dehydrogenase (quinone) [unclassified Olleya]|uniref:malate dehydrogenase (quinone) n=1 Tax=unclassified Olleya TaxID=2615019 RepID=UPI000C31ADC7|nr:MULTISPECIES: malate dehydrogenase (quinone) [unclassified Olleya]AUC76086.1 malate dehydrogenase (quinone) [Olleya sp. Bg11-27]QXP58281.1 malate dehydrogenase (quinone) [Olleya sp. HaHaR_3_96]